MGLSSSEYAEVYRLVLGLGVVGIVMMGLDKLQAVSGGHRISERSLWYVAFAGGFWGVILGGVFFRHKIHKPSFWVPVGAAVLVWAGLKAILG